MDNRQTEILEALWFCQGWKATLGEMDNYTALITGPRGNPVPEMIEAGLVVQRDEDIAAPAGVKLQQPAWISDKPPVWQVGDGDAENVFSIRAPFGGKPVPGHFCLWSCKWPGHSTVYYNPDMMDDGQLYWTMRDFQALDMGNGLGKDCGLLLLELDGKLLTSTQSEQARGLLSRAADWRPSYTPPWINKVLMGAPTWRPGWGWPGWARTGGRGIINRYLEGKSENVFSGVW